MDDDVRLDFSLSTNDIDAFLDWNNIRPETSLENLDAELKSCQPHRGMESIVGERKENENLICAIYVCNCDGEKQQVLRWLFFLVSPSLFAPLPALQSLIKYLTRIISNEHE